MKQSIQFCPPEKASNADGWVKYTTLSNFRRVDKVYKVFNLEDSTKYTNFYNFEGFSVLVAIYAQQ